MKQLIAIFSILVLQACGTIDYKPEKYEIDQQRIQDFPVAGSVSVINLQQNKDKTLFFDGTSDWSGDYYTVSEHFSSQLREEIAKHGKVSGTLEKSINVKIVRLEAKQKAFHFVSEMDVMVRLGQGKEFELSVGQGSPGNMWRVLNGTLAIGVIELLKDKRVLDYLAAE
ncbi:MAG: hypothetical protein ACRBBR_01940 [Cellvibrionaceae bacterium]